MAGPFPAGLAAPLAWPLQRGYPSSREFEFLVGTDPLDVTGVTFGAAIVQPNIALSVVTGADVNKIIVSITGDQTARLTERLYEWVLDDTDNNAPVLAGTVTVYPRGVPGPASTSTTVQIVNQTITIAATLITPPAGGISGGAASSFGGS